MGLSRNSALEVYLGCLQLLLKTYSMEGKSVDSSQADPALNPALSPAGFVIMLEVSSQSLSFSL
jgi:hypothetical protein